MIRFAPFRLRLRFGDICAAALLALLCQTGFTATAPAGQGSYSFGVVAQRNAAVTAQYWNPILEYVAAKAGVRLELKTTRTAQESSEALRQGAYDFYYGNHIFKAPIDKLGYRPILRPRDAHITGQVVTLSDSSLRQLDDLRGQPVGFPSRASFVAYAVVMDQLLRQRIDILPVFGGNQEGIMGQLKNGRVVAAAVNSEVMRSYAQREGINYRVLWQSPPFPNQPIAAHPRVPRKALQAIRQAFAHMADDPEGLQILTTSAALLQQAPPLGFNSAEPAEFRAYSEFFRKTLVKDIE